MKLSKIFYFGCRHKMIGKMEWSMLMATILVVLAGLTLATNTLPQTPNLNEPKPAEDEDPVSRANYGVLFKPIKTIYPASSVWVHMFKIKLPPWLGQFKFKGGTCDGRPRTPEIITRTNPEFEQEFTTRTEEHEDECERSPQSPNCKVVTGNMQTPDFKCIVQNKIIRKLKRLRTSLLARYNLLRAETLQLTETNNTGEHRQKRELSLTQEKEASESIQLDTAVKWVDNIMRAWNRSMSTADEIATDIMEDIPYIPKHSRRQKRNPFAWIGKNLFGLATNEDIKRMGRIVNHLLETQTGSIQQFETLRDDTVSYMKIANERMDSVTANIKLLYESLRANSEALSQRSTANAQLLVYLTGAMGTVIDGMTQISLEVEQFASGIRSLIQGQLSPSLVKKQDMLNTIEQLQDRLRRDYSAFHLTETGPGYYYKYAKVQHFRTDEDELYITMTFPLSSIKKMFYLYSVNIYNSPLKQNSEFTSRLGSQVDYFGVTEDGRNFIELTQKEYSQCQDTSAVRCTSAIKIFDAEHPTCMAALFMDRPEAIHQLCSYQFEKTEPKVEMMDVGNGKLTIMNADFAIIQCQQDMPRQRDGCTYCRIDFLCGCSVYVANNVSNAAMPARLTNCKPPLTEYKIEYPVNMAVLGNVFDLSEVANVGGDEFFLEEYVPNYPGITIAKDFDVNLNRDYAYSMDLKQVMNKAKSRQSVAPISIRAMASWYISTPSEFFSVPNVMSLFALLVAAAACLDSWRTRRSVRIFKTSMEAMISMNMADFPSVRGQVPDNQDNLEKMVKLFGDMQQGVEELAEETGMISVPTSVITTQNWVTILGVTCLIILTIYLIRRLYDRRIFSRSSLCIEIASADKAVTVFVMKLPGSPTNYHFRISGLPRVSKIAGTWYNPQVEIMWSGLELIDRLSGLKYGPPASCAFSPMYRKRMASILKVQYAITLKFKQGTEVSYVQSVCGSNCDGQRCQGGVRGANIGSTLYPSLSVFDRLHTMYQPGRPATEAASAPSLDKTEPLAQTAVTILPGVNVG